MKRPIFIIAVIAIVIPALSGATHAQAQAQAQAQEQEPPQVGIYRQMLTERESQLANISAQATAKIGELQKQVDDLKAQLATKDKNAPATAPIGH